MPSPLPRSQTSEPAAAAPTCHLCGQPALETVPAFAALHRVTSDCKPWPPGGTLARCRTCGLVQALVTPQWQADADTIYREYTIYHQSGGAEQPVFDRTSGQPLPRSERILQALRHTLTLPPQGRLLDVGCGNGSLLSAWNRLLPGWSLCGTEVHDTHRATLERLPAFERLFTQPIETIPGPFDFISLIHVLEHIPSPVRYLQHLRPLLRPGGHLLIEVPDCAQNPTMLLVADHCSHLSPPFLAGIAAAAGFTVLQATSDWVPKEATVLAQPQPPPDPRPWPLSPAVSDEILANWPRLEALRARAESLAHLPHLGLFGTAIAATWLDAQTHRAARFFVDEDPHRIGRTHLGRPILAPAQVPPHATVFLSLPEPLATAVATRLRAAHPTLQLALP